mmetsp:Transcript_12714/g.32484  ORF Transcript_12714/g.32484 Transcript_12714/m.32484 type:complete len:417 (-) Transcript_12714:270-1520(-)
MLVGRTAVKNGQRARRRQEALKKAEDSRAAKIEEECGEVFSQADTDKSGILEPTEVRALISKLTGDENISEPVYRQLVGFALEKFPGRLDAHISRGQMKNLLSAARSYTKQRSIVDELLAKHDDDGSGVLDIRQFVLALFDLSPDGVRVRAGDVLWLMSKCDLDGDRMLSFAELVPALGLWRDIAGPLDTLYDDDEDDPERDELEMILEAVSAGFDEIDEGSHLGKVATKPNVPAQLAGADASKDTHSSEALPGAVQPMVFGFVLSPDVGAIPLVGSPSGSSSGHDYEQIAASKRGVNKSVVSQNPQIRRQQDGSFKRNSNSRPTAGRKSKIVGLDAGRGSMKVLPVEGLEVALKPEDRCHRLEGATVLKRGVSKASVRTLSGKLIFVDNEQLKDAERAVARKNGLNSGTSCCSIS